MNYWGCHLEIEKDHNFANKHQVALLSKSDSADTLRLTTELLFMVLILLLELLSVPGVEPEPFEIGDHIVEASGKMCLLDKLLSFLYAGYVMLGWGWHREKK